MQLSYQIFRWKTVLTDTISTSPGVVSLCHSTFFVLLIEHYSDYIVSSLEQI